MGHYGAVYGYPPNAWSNMNVWIGVYFRNVS